MGERERPAKRADGKKAKPDGKLQFIQRNGTERPEGKGKRPQGKDGKRPQGKEGKRPEREENDEDEDDEERERPAKRQEFIQRNETERPQGKGKRPEGKGKRPEGKEGKR